MLMWILLYLTMGFLVATLAAHAYQQRRALDFFRDIPGMIAYLVMVVFWPVPLGLAIKAYIQLQRRRDQ